MASSVKRGSPSWLRIGAWLAAALVLLLLCVDSSNRLIQQTQSANLYCFSRNLWMTVAPLPRRPLDLGAVFQGQLWVATHDEVDRFDGKSWVPAPQALKTSRPAALAASSAGIWVLDFNGNLSHFDGSAWTFEALAGKLPGVTWGIRGALRPTLAADDDGSVWILWDGLWHRSAGVWTEVRPEGRVVIGARLVGESAGYAWLGSDGKVEAVTPTGVVAARFSADVLGSSVRDVYKVVSVKGAFWLATPAGLAVFDGASWRNLGAPPQSGGVLDAAPAPDGGLYVLGAPPAVGLSARLSLAWPVILLAGAALSLLAYVFRSILRLRRHRRDQGVGPVLGIGFDPRNRFAARWTLQALRECDYRGATRTIRGLSLGLPSRTMLLLEGTALSLGGFPEEAEKRCRRALRRTSGEQSRFALDRLGAILTELGRYDEARECLEEAVQLDDSFDLACADLAELLLTEGGDAARALELAERAAAAKPSPAAYRVGRQLNAEALALRAWALAALGRRLEAEIVVQRTFDAIDQDCPPIVAGVYCRLAMALQSIPDRNAAMTHFRNASMLDPKGRYGNFARGQLSQRSAWGVSA